MTNFTRCNKISEVYRSTDKIANFKFKVKFKEVNTVIPLPKFETFALQEGPVEQENTGYYEEKTFSWQEKALGPPEIYLCSDLNNCTTDAEKKYHEKIVNCELNLDDHKNKLFSYVNEDDYDCNLQERLTTGTNSQINDLGKMVHVLKLNKGDTHEEDGTEILKQPNFKKTDTVIGDIDSHLEKMYILVDMNNRESDPTFLLRRERILFTLTWNAEKKQLRVLPDFNDININPYFLEVNYYSKQIFHYSIEHVIDDFFDEAKLAEMELLNQIELSHKQIHKSKIFRNFSLPPKNVLKCLYIVEILSAHFFEYNNLYVEYNIELPYGFVSSSPLKGVTQTAQTKGPDKDAHFVHVFEVCVNYQMDLVYEEEVLTREPDIYFEIISCDAWGRQRTEGYCHSRLPVTQPGPHARTLMAARPQGNDQRLWEMNRYFVGGRHLLNDLTWLAIPGTLEGKKLNKFGIKTVSTGRLKIGINVILQSRNFATSKSARELSVDLKEPIAERLSADSLFKSVNTVLQAYKHAKEKLVSCQESEDK